MEKENKETKCKYKKLLVEVADIDDNGYRYKVVDDDTKGIAGETEGIFADILDKTGGKSVDKIEGYRVWLVVHPMEEFLNAGDKMQENECPLAQDLLLYDQTKRDNEDKELAMIPVVHITTTSIMLPAIYTAAPLHRMVPRYHLIVDDSIWNYHVSIFDKEEIEKLLPKDDPNIETVKEELKDFAPSFREALKSIKKNYDRHLYHLQVAKEYADLHARMSGQAYLTGSHSAGVSPFVFHSEGFVKMMIKHEFKGDGEAMKKSLKKEDIIRHKWRFLLVDDKAVKEMSHKPELKVEEEGTDKPGLKVEEEGTDKPELKKEEEGTDKPELKKEEEGTAWNSKLAIIEWTLRHCFEWENEENVSKIQHRPWNNKKNFNDDDCVILIEYAETLADAQDAMKSKKYDIVLLDYLLDTDKKTRDQNYGFSLLNDIYRDKNDNDEFNKYKYGPADRFFFMFISAYTTAVYERLRAETLNLSEDYWHISLGACPTNTPQLFLYNLLKLMEKRLNDSGVPNLSARRIRELMEEIYKDGEGGNAVRRRANKRYEKVLSLHYHYRKIMKDVAIPTSDSVFDTKGSVLMTDFATKNQNLGGLLEHMANLVHITAFGTIRQWPEMWEEYLYFKALYKQMLDDKDDEEKAEGLFSDIEDYILKLKQVQG